MTLDDELEVEAAVEARISAEISAAIGDNRYLDPPDGGDVTLAEQVRRMRADRDALAARLARAEYLLHQVRGCLPLASQQRVDRFLGPTDTTRAGT